MKKRETGGTGVRSESPDFPAGAKMMGIVTRHLLFLSTAALIVPSVSFGAQDTQQVDVGSVLISIPRPDTLSSAVEAEELGRIERFSVPLTNHLLCAFVPTNDLPRLAAGDDIWAIPRRALVEVNCRAESASYEVGDFEDVVAAMDQARGDVVDSLAAVAIDEFNRRMRGFDRSEDQVELDQTVQLGRLFSRQDAYGFGMLLAISSQGEVKETVAAMAVLRVKKRLLFAYLYSERMSVEEIRRLGQEAEDWSNAILAANAKN